MNAPIKPAGFPAHSVSRRSFLASVAVTGGALALGFRVPFATAAETSPEITAWILIAPDDTVTIRLTRPEMGQGAFTAQPMLVAEDLDCDWSKVRPEFVTAHDNKRRNRVWGDMSAGGSRSVRNSQEYLRKAGATARAMLIEAAAKRWGVPVSECTAANSVIRHASGKTLRYGEVAQEAAAILPPQNVALKDPKKWKLMGTAIKRLDLRDKVVGAIQYGTDVSVPGMVFAAVAQSPVFGGKLKSVDETKVHAMRGVRQVVKLDDAVAVVADNWWRAKKALEALVIVWDEGANGQHSDATILAYMKAGAHAEGLPASRTDGDARTALAGAKTVIRADYNVPFLNHATMEPQNCTVHVTKDKVEVWAPSQNPEETLNHTARISGVAPENIIVHGTHLGCGLGRRGVEQDYTILAVKIAMQVNAPVKVLWSREEDMQHDCFRPVAAARFEAALGADNMIEVFSVAAAMPSIAARYRPERIKGNLDSQSLEGFNDDWTYHVPHFEARNAMRPVHVPVGNWRSVNYTQNTFYRESFMDELAVAAGEDPVAFRRKHLKASTNPLAAKDLAVLEAVAEKAGWGEKRPGRFQGVAVQRCFDAHSAQIVEISFTNGELKIHRVVAAVDPGYAVNLEAIAGQVEGSIAMALSAALYGEITIEKGRVVQGNFDTYRLIRIDEMPEVETIIMPSGGFWGGVGESSLPALTPALCNAIFAATGKRIRSLPLKNHDFKIAGGGANAASL
jgi:isoquinoline 1-oxidoreductase beta subunit